MNNSRAGKVTEVIDGDTFEVQYSNNLTGVIRLAGVDTPEKGKRGYESAKRALEQLIGGKNVEINTQGKSYRRDVADVRTKSGVNISNYMKKYNK